MSVTVACEPTWHRWRVLDQLAAQRGLALVCVQPLLVYRAREGEDLTFERSLTPPRVQSNPTRRALCELNE